MKIQLFAIAVISSLLLFAAACTQTRVDPNATTGSSLTSARISGVSNSTATSSSVSNGTCLRGGNVEVVITTDKLPATVLAYLASNYAGYAIVQAEQGTNRDGKTYYEVKFTASGVTKELHFDMTGAVLADGKGGHSTGKDCRDGKGGSTEVVITKDKLPAAALAYLNANYAGYTFVQAEQGTDPKGAIYYEVDFTLNGATKELHFDAAGALKP
jgi:uncharacterized membrane protein YkoI